MKERPILFSGEMVRAILDNRKTQTRRVMAVVNYMHNGRLLGDWALSHFYGLNGDGFADWDIQTDVDDSRRILIRSPFGVVGDRLWVKEAFLPDPPRDHDSWDDWKCSSYEWDGCGSKLSMIPPQLRKPEHCLYRATWQGSELIWRPSLHMPRWASRITLEVTNARVERVQEISEADAEAEIGDGEHNTPLCRIHSPRYDSEGVCTEPGYCSCGDYSYPELFAAVWDSIYGKQGYGWDANPWVFAYTFKRVTD
jgi:hypothetical protein